MKNKMGKNDNLSNDQASIFTVISGSFRKHLKQISLLKIALKKYSIVVLSPTGNIAVNPKEEFIILDSDPVSNPRMLQDSVFAKIRRSTFLSVANIDGYLGKAAIMEIGYAIGLGIPIYTLEPVSDPNLKLYCMSLTKAFPEIEDLMYAKTFNIEQKSAVNS